MLVSTKPAPRRSQTQFEARFASEPGTWTVIDADMPEEAAARFVRDRERTTGRYLVASGRNNALVVVRTLDNTALSATYSVSGQAVYYANVAEPGKALPVAAGEQARA